MDIGDHIYIKLALSTTPLAIYIYIYIKLALSTTALATHTENFGFKTFLLMDLISS